MRPYPWRVTKTPEPPPKPEPHRVLPDAVRALIEADEEGPIMVTTWAVVAEYIDEDGAASVAADMLDVDEFDDEEIDDD